MASSTSKEPASRAFQPESVGAQGYRERHAIELARDGMSFSGNERDKLFFNHGDASFLDVSSVSGCDSPADGRAAIGADFDHDGDLDLFVHEIQLERHRLYRNELGGRSVKVRLRATKGHWEAIGATVYATTPKGRVAQAAQRGNGFQTCAPPEIVIGLGASDAARIEVRWPGGDLEEFGAVSAGACVELVQGSGKPKSIAVSAGRLADPRPPGVTLVVGAKVPTFEALDARGAVVTVDPGALAAGEELRLVLWSRSCAGCVRELPDVERARGKRLLLCVDAESERATAEKLRAERAPSVTARYLGAPARAGASRLEDLLDLARLPLPTFLVVGSDGRLRAVERHFKAAPR